MTHILLDNEAIQALRDPFHSKHRVVLAHLAAIVTRRKRGRAANLVVPTSVRVEAGWSRIEPTAAAINRFRITDHPLDTASANIAATIQSQNGVSVADAHLGAAIGDVTTSGADSVVVLTSDPDDIKKVAGRTPITVIRI